MYPGYTPSKSQKWQKLKMLNHKFDWISDPAANSRQTAVSSIHHILQQAWPFLFYSSQTPILLHHKTTHQYQYTGVTNKHIYVTQLIKNIFVKSVCPVSLGNPQIQYYSAEASQVIIMIYLLQTTYFHNIITTLVQ